jgi:hypothetical protein
MSKIEMKKFGIAKPKKELTCVNAYLCMIKREKSGCKEQGE